MASASRLQRFLYLTLISLLPTALVASTSPMSLPGCPEKCGNITIPYPFGTRPGCYRPGFHVTCISEPTTRPKAIADSNIELLGIDITSGEARAYNFISYACYNQTSLVNTSNSAIDISHTTIYLFANRRNKFTAIGCYSPAYIIGRGEASYQSSCVSFCERLNNPTGHGGSCNGSGCCQTKIHAGLNYYEVQWGFDENKAGLFNTCSYSALIEEDWYKFQVQDLLGYDFLARNQKGVPVVLDWAIRENGTCINGVEQSSNPACLSENSDCYNTSNGQGYLCKCLNGYEGNPYIPGGCIVEFALTQKETMYAPTRKARIMAMLRLDMESRILISPIMFQWLFLLFLASLYCWAKVFQ